jgi:hypothetical protein
MASFLGGIFRTPRSNATRPREESPKDDLSPESVLSSPIAASLLVKNGQTSSLKKLVRPHGGSLSSVNESTLTALG